MKRYLCGLLGLTLLGANPLSGQTPTAVPTGPGSVPADALVVPAGPDGAACTPTRTVCVREHYVKETTKVAYSSGQEPLCVCRFRLFGHCDGIQCKIAYTRRYLIKKVRTCKEDACRCVPVEVPACGPGGCPSASHAWPAASATCPAAKVGP